MRTKLAHGKISVKKSLLHGYGVFAEQTFMPNDIIEECYVLPTPPDVLEDYVFGLKNNKVLVLGFGSIYNHGDPPNAKVEFDQMGSLATFSAKTKIKKGEEILIYYGKNWFASRKIPIKKLSTWEKIYFFLRRSAYLFRFIFIISLVLFSILLLRFLS
jgi:hypothetical protein